MKNIIQIGTRGSPLALAQTRWVVDLINERHPDIRVNLIKIKTTGDRVLDTPLADIGGKGLFVKEIEEALISGEIDVAVHSMKDLPGELPEGLYIGIIPEREDSRDVMISQNGLSFKGLPGRSSIGTSSMRRSSQILRHRPDLKIVPLRGNLDTRIKKLDAENFQAVVVAAAGLNRLGIYDRRVRVLPIELMLPAIGQGALALELRKQDKATADILRFLDHYPTRVAVEAERGFLRKLQAGCQLPVAAHAAFKGSLIEMSGMVASPDGKEFYLDVIEGKPESSGQLGAALADRLLEAGAKKVLDEVYKTDLHP